MQPSRSVVLRGRWARPKLERGEETERRNLKMAVRTVWRRATVFSFFLLVLGVVEYFVVVQLHSSLQVGEREEELLLAGRGRSLSLLEGGAERWEGRRVQAGSEERGGGEVAGVNLDQTSEVRLARELHDQRVDRLRNFERRTGSLLADQQRRNFGVREKQLQVGNGQRQAIQRGGSYNDRLAEILNLSRLVDEILSPKGKGDQALRQFFEQTEGERLKERLDKLYDIYAAKGKKDSATKDRDRDFEEDYVEVHEDYDSEEEEEQYRRVFDPEDFVLTVGADGRVNVSRKPLEPEVLVENMTLPARNMTRSEKAGLNILLSIRTTVSNHRKRLPLLFETWLTQVNTSQVFLVTDGNDPFTRLWTSVKGIHYVDAKCGNSYSREQLCCKAGVELALLFQEHNKAFDWFCHVDDDMYVNMRNLISLLSGFNPRRDPVYLGRSGSPWHTPRRVKRKAQLSRPGKKYHFAVGGMYCLSRAMLNKTMQWIVGGDVFSKSCSLTREPEDVTIGFIVAMLNYSLSRTERINTHGLHLATTVDPYTLTDQVAISYGYGSVRWGEDPYNAVYIPDAVFSLEEDESQFRSLHCVLYPATSWCVQQRDLIQQLRDRLMDNLEYSNYSDDKSK